MRGSLLLIIILGSTAIFGQDQQVKRYAPELFSPYTSGAVCGFANKGKTIFFIREDTTKDKLIIYTAERKGDKWVNESPLPFSGAYNDMGGRLSQDGKILYFTSDRPGGSSRENDDWNIWKSENQDGTWSTPEPLTDINNKGNECCPLPMPDGTLVFSGDGKRGAKWQMLVWNGSEESPLEILNNINGWQWPSSCDEKEQLILLNSMKRPDTKGMDDVYVSFYINNEWASPVNIGEPVNTAVYEDGAILSPNGKHLIFNRHETGSTPSQVMFVKWKPILKKLKKSTR